MRHLGPTAPAARGWHGVTAAVAAVALTVQLGLVISGASVLVTTAPAPGLGTRVLRFVSYFTVQSNVLVLLVSAICTLDPLRDSRLLRIIRLDALVGITVTGLVHWFLLRPLLDLHGLSYLTDKLLHVAVPLLALGGWLLVRPRELLSVGGTAGTVLRALVWPVGWLVYTTLHGAVTGWYPYPFLDVSRHGYGPVALDCLGVAVLFVVLAAGLLAADRLLAGPDRRTSTGIA
jgi:hypothetical protein